MLSWIESATSLIDFKPFEINVSNTHISTKLRRGIQQSQFRLVPNKLDRKPRGRGVSFTSESFVIRYVHNCIIKHSFIGPYTSIGNNVTIKRGEIENSIIMDNYLIDANERITDSLIAPHSKIISNRKNKPSGRRFILGERSYVQL